jgi:hypothetical protein
MDYYPTIKKNKIPSFTGKWMILKSIMLSEVNQVEKVKIHIFCHMWKIDKYKYKHYHIHIYLQNLFPLVEL